nr:hypothetical protein CFP56_22413 [Quercus suber]
MVPLPVGIPCLDRILQESSLSPTGNILVSTTASCCGNCNRSKQQKHVIEFRLSSGGTRACACPRHVSPGPGREDNPPRDHHGQGLRGQGGPAPRWMEDVGSGGGRD